MTTYAHAVSLNFVSARDAKRAHAVPLMTVGRAIPPQIGYIAGAADGIVTVRGKPAKRDVLLMDANDYAGFIGRVWSTDNGHYMFTDLDPDKQYLIMARDYNKEFEPFAYDYVTPATDITPDEQHALRESWAK